MYKINFLRLKTADSGPPMGMISPYTASKKNKMAHRNYIQVFLEKEREILAFKKSIKNNEKYLQTSFIQVSKHF